MTFSAERCDAALAALRFPSIGDEIGFSWSPCDLCGSPLGGERFHVAHADDDTAKYPLDGVLIPVDRFRCCTDCALYVANGTLPEGGAR